MNEKIDENTIEKIDETIYEKNIINIINEAQKDIRYHKNSITEIRAKLNMLKKSVIKVNKMTDEIQKIVKITPEAERLAKQNKAYPINKKILNLFNLPSDTLLSNVNLIKQFHQYITFNNLRNKIIREKITPDDALKDLFELKETDELTYFNLDSHIKSKRRPP
jgi:polyribonucleotide nucleotidyltransferase